MQIHCSAALMSGGWTHYHLLSTNLVSLITSALFSPLSVMLISNLFLCYKNETLTNLMLGIISMKAILLWSLISSLTFRCESCTCHADSFSGFFWNLAAAHLWFTLLGMFFKRTAHLFSKCCTPQAPALRRLSYGNLWNLPSWWVNMPLSEYSDFVQYRLEF